MPKITIIGAGSTGLTKAFLADILTRPQLAETTTVSLMDIRARRQLSELQFN